jgi:fructokinase
MPNTPPKIIAHGELLIDFVPTVTGVTLIEAPAFIKAPGGAPANVAVSLAKLGESVGFMGQVGDDAFGHFLAQTLSEHKVNISALKFSREARTALAFVSLKADGDRDFMFYRHPSADMLYAPTDVDEAAVRSCKVFHFGSISLIGEPSRSATLHAIKLAARAGAMISYDPNLRLPLWPSAQAAREGMLLGWPLANLIKVSEEELEFLSGESDWQRAAKSLWHDKLNLLLVTRGPQGCYYMTQQFAGEVPGVKVSAVDTTGAGDAFMAGMIHGLLRKPDALSNEFALRELCRFANANGALTTTQRGAIPALPTQAQVETFLGSLASHSFDA